MIYVSASQKQTKTFILGHTMSVLTLTIELYFLLYDNNDLLFTFNIYIYMHIYVYIYIYFIYMTII